MERNKDKMLKLNILKILMLVLTMFLGIVFFGDSKVFAVTETGTSESSGYEITWLYETDGNGNAINLRISKVMEISGGTEITEENAIEYRNQKWENEGLNSNDGVITTLSIPSAINGHTVISIGNGINKIIFPNVAYDCYFHNVVIPNTVKSINNRAFYNCESIQQINFGTSLENIGDYAFWNVYDLKTANENDGVTKLHFPDSLKTIGKYAFQSDYISTHWYGVTEGHGQRFHRKRIFILVLQFL